MRKSFFFFKFFGIPISSAACVWIRISQIQRPVCPAIERSYHWVSLRTAPVSSTNELFGLIISPLFNCNLEAATVKFRGRGYAVKSSSWGDKWAIVINVGRPLQQVVGDSFCAFCSYFSKPEQQQMLLSQSAVIRTAIPCSTPRDQGCKHLRQDRCNEPTGGKLQLLSWGQPPAYDHWSLDMILNRIVFSYKPEVLCALSVLFCQTVSFPLGCTTGKVSSVHRDGKTSCWWGRAIEPV